MPDKYQEPIEEGTSELLKESLPIEKGILTLAEKEILELEKKLAEKKAELAKEKKVEAEPSKERVEKIEEVLEEEKIVPAPPAPPAPPSAQVQKQVKQMASLTRQNQVKTLCDLAFQKGLGFAIEVAKGLDNAYVLDEFHDTLVDELYKRLVEEEKLKKL